MTREEIIKKREEALQTIQQGLMAIESLKGQVAAHRGKVIVYDDLLEELAEPPQEGPIEVQG